MARHTRCLTLLNPVVWQNWLAAYLGCTLRMKTLFRGWPVVVHDMHTRRSAVGRSFRSICNYASLVSVDIHRSNCHSWKGTRSWNCHVGNWHISYQHSSLCCFFCCLEHFAIQRHCVWDTWHLQASRENASFSAVWNTLPSSITASETLGTFKHRVKTHLFLLFGTLCHPASLRPRHSAPSSVRWKRIFLSRHHNIFPSAFTRFYFAVSFVKCSWSNFYSTTL